MHFSLFDAGTDNFTARLALGGLACIYRLGRGTDRREY